MIHINRNEKSPDADWIEKADQITAQLLAAETEAQRFEIIDNNEGLWGELKEFLLGLSDNKCWYSESNDSYVHLHVDHFRPKKAAFGLDKIDHGGYWWLAFKWTNYRVCGPPGNVRKKDKFAVRNYKATCDTDVLEDEIIYFLDPTDEEDVLKLTFDNSGAVASLAKNGWDAERSEYTIRELNLNLKKLKENRKKVWTDCSNLLTELQELMNENNVHPSPYRRGQIKEKLKTLTNMIDKATPFSATAKACLNSSGIEWAYRI